MICRRLGCRMFGAGSSRSWLSYFSIARHLDSLRDVLFDGERVGVLGARCQARLLPAHQSRPMRERLIFRLPRAARCRKIRHAQVRPAGDDNPP